MCISRSNWDRVVELLTKRELCEAAFLDLYRTKGKEFDSLQELQSELKRKREREATQPWPIIRAYREVCGELGNDDEVFTDYDNSNHGWDYFYSHDGNGHYRLRQEFVAACEANDHLVRGLE